MMRLACVEWTDGQISGNGTSAPIALSPWAAEREEVRKEGMQRKKERRRKDERMEEKERKVEL